MLGAGVENMFSQYLGGDPCSPVNASRLKQEGVRTCFIASMAEKAMSRE